MSRETASREARGIDSSRFANTLALSAATLHVSTSRPSHKNEDDIVDDEVKPGKAKKAPLAERLLDTLVAQQRGDSICCCLRLCVIQTYIALQYNALWHNACVCPCRHTMAARSDPKLTRKTWIGAMETELSRRAAG